MPEKETEVSSAMQLYQKAYHLQYEKKNTTEACRIYRGIIRQFPDSDASAYSAVQLEKMDSDLILKQSAVPLIYKIIIILSAAASVAALGMSAYVVYLVK